MRSASEVAMRSFNEYIEEREMSSTGGERKRKIIGRQKGGREREGERERERERGGRERDRTHRSTEGKKGRDEN